MKKIKPFIVDWAIYPFDIAVFLAHSDKEVLSFISKRYDLTDLEKEAITMEGNGRTVMLHGGQTIIRTRLIPKKGSGILAHEIFHAVAFLFDRIGIELCKQSDEAYAYAIQYLTNEINKQL